jgi:hypothetical protein
VKSKYIFKIYGSAINPTLRGEAFILEVQTSNFEFKPLFGCACAFLEILLKNYMLAFRRGALMSIIEVTVKTRRENVTLGIRLAIK